MKIIVLVGPPGVGKSTLVKVAREKGYWSSDLEEYNPKKKRIEMIPNLLKEAHVSGKEVAFFGAADVGSKFPDNEVERVLLLPPKDIYLERFKKRDDEDEEKRKQAQKAEIIYEDFKVWLESGVGKYHQIIQTLQNAEETIDLIVKNLRRKRAIKKIDDCEFDYWMILLFVRVKNETQIALFKCGPYWTTYYMYNNNEFEGAKDLAGKELGIDESMSYPGRFINMSKDLTFPWDKKTVVRTAVIRLQQKDQLKPTVDRFKEFEWFTKKEAEVKLKGNKFECAFKNEFDEEDTFWEGLDK